MVCGDQQTLVIDRKRRRALLECCNFRQRDHGLAAGGDGRSGRGNALPGRTDRVGGLVARGLGVGCTGRAGVAWGDDRACHRVGRLRAADRSAGRADIDVLQRLRVLPVARRDLHDDVILVARDIDRRHLPLAEGVVEGVVDLAHRDAEPGRGVAVDHEIGFQALVLLVAVDVGEIRIALQGRRDLRRPFIELLQRRSLQRVLILRVRGPAPDPDVLHRLQEQARARHHRHLAAQPRDHAVGADLALIKRTKRDEHEAGIGLPAAGEADRRLNRRIALDDADEPRELLLHQLERHALVSLDRADQPASVLLREEALRDHVVEIEVEAEHRRQDQHHRQRMRQRRGQRSAVEVQHRLEEPLARPIEPAMAAGVRLEQHGAHHRRGRQRDRERDQDRDRDHHRELAEQPPDDAGHQQDRDEHRDQRDAHRQHGEADLVGALQRRLERAQPLLDVAGDVLQHHDGVVDHEAGRDRQRHQGEVVEAVAEQVHRPEGRNQRHRDRHHRNEGGPRIAQEGEHHDDDQQHRQNQGSFDVPERGADGGRTVDRKADVDRRRD
ncbi:hypothetical protein ACVIIY_004421 [Bradyrhizobium sp. USDA 4515]